MQVFKNELRVYRGESFTIDKTLQNRDGTPYIISSALANPYFLLSVSNTQYAQENRYIKNYWLNLDNFPRFESTQVFDIRTLKTENGGNISRYNEFDDVDDEVLHGYLNGLYVEVELTGYAVCTDGTGYKYWNGSRWQDYECRIVKTFTTEDTSEWISQNYFYSIQLVSGAETTEGEHPIVVQTSYPILPPSAIKVTNYVQGDSIWQKT